MAASASGHSVVPFFCRGARGAVWDPCLWAGSERWTRPSPRSTMRSVAAVACCSLRASPGSARAGSPKRSPREAHERYQARHGGKTKASVHHAIPRSRIAQWHDQWEQVAIFFRPETRASVGASATRWRKEWSPEQPSVLRRNQGPKVLHRAAVLRGRHAERCTRTDEPGDALRRMHLERASATRACARQGAPDTGEADTPPGSVGYSHEPCARVRGRPWPGRGGSRALPGASGDVRFGTPHPTPWRRSCVATIDGRLGDTPLPSGHGWSFDPAP